MPELFLNGKHILIKKGHRLIVRWDRKEVYGVVKVLQSGNVPGPLLPSRKKLPSPDRLFMGQSKGFQVVIKRGKDADQAFWEWFESTRDPTCNEGEARKDIEVKIVDEIGEVLASYSLINCLPIDLIIQPGLDANAGKMGMEELVLETKGLMIEE